MCCLTLFQVDSTVGISGLSEFINKCENTTSLKLNIHLKTYL